MRQINNSSVAAKESSRQAGLIIDQTPRAGEEVVFDYPVGITITEVDFRDQCQWR